VNPSLTITAMTERAMSRVADVVPWQERSPAGLIQAPPEPRREKTRIPVGFLMTAVATVLTGLAAILTIRRRRHDAGQTSTQRVQETMHE
jgi:hypothetical protein